MRRRLKKMRRRCGLPMANVHGIKLAQCSTDFVRASKSSQATLPVVWTAVLYQWSMLIT